MTDAPESARGTAARLFSRAAAHYDDDQARNRVARWSRARSLGLLHRNFRSGDLLLEIGCGTGVEAIALARKGRRIVATDAAPGMIDVLNDKLDREPSLRRNVAALVSPAGELGKLVGPYGSAAFDGAYSSFGPLNCEPNLRLIAAGLAELVKPGGRVVLSLINRYCLWETAWHILLGRPSVAFRRWTGLSYATVRAERSDERVPVFYWSPRELRNSFEEHFDLARTLALPWALPPQYLDRLLQGRPALFNFLALLERRFASVWPANLCGDHIVLVLRRRTNTRNELWTPLPLSMFQRAKRTVMRQLLRLRYKRFVPGGSRGRWVRAADERLWVGQGVFDPRLHFTSEYFAHYLRSASAAGYVRGRVLDLGTGSGLLAAAAVRAGANHVTAVDINPSAVRAARKVCERLGRTRMRVMKSDLFSALPDERFDLIITNPPYFPGEPNNHAERAYFAGANLEWFDRVASAASDHLAASGTLLMVLSEAAPVRQILEIFNSRNWASRIVDRTLSSVETLLIVELKSRNDDAARHLNQ